MVKEQDLGFLFQSTLPRGERQSGNYFRVYQYEISIHAPAWGATNRRHGSKRKYFYFNPRSRVGSDAAPSLACHSKNISIHAPAWGATKAIINFNHLCNISIHAPAWGATSQNFCHTNCPSISIHAPAWGATFDFAMTRQAILISIHAPAWGATSCY